MPTTLSPPDHAHPGPAKAYWAKAVNAFLHDTRTIYSVLLPPYAPELNPIGYAVAPGAR